MQKQTDIHIAVAADDRYGKIAGAVIVSVLKNTPGRKIVFCILDSDLSNRNKDRISSLKNRFPNGEFRFYPVGGISVFDQLKLPDYISRAAMLRLLLPDLLKEIDKVLYLDCDTVCCSDIEEIWDVPLGDRWIAGVLDSNRRLDEHCSSLGLKANRYFNSGVLVMNLAEMRRMNYMKVFAEIAETYEDRITMGDQDLLNIAAFGKFKQLPLRWNLHRGHLKYPMPWINRGEISEALKNPGIVHFTGARKPWQWSFKKERHKLWQKWFLAVRGTVFSEEALFSVKRILSLFREN